MLVNNAGVGAIAPLLMSDIDDMEYMIDVNVKAAMRLVYAAVPPFVERTGHRGEHGVHRGCGTGDTQRCLRRHKDLHAGHDAFAP